MAIKMPEILGFIPARGGSKGIPRKNLAPLAGKPLIAWTIAAALQSKSISRLIVSTDDAEIAETARRHGAEAPFIRPAKLSKDKTPGIAPLLHALEWLKKNEGRIPDYVMFLQPTSPLRSAADIDTAAELARKSGSPHVISVRPAPCHPFHIARLGKGNAMLSFFEESYSELQKLYPRRQDLPPACIENGAIYLSRCKELVAAESFYEPSATAFVMSEENSLDIDSASDLLEAAKILRARKGRV